MSSFFSPQLTRPLDAIEDVVRSKHHHLVTKYNGFYYNIIKRDSGNDMHTNGDVIVKKYLLALKACTRARTLV